MNPFEYLAPEGVQKLVAYDPGHEPSEIRSRFNLPEVIELGSNENSYGPSPAVRELLAAPGLLSYRYPDAGGRVLKAALAQHYQLDAAHFTLGNGTHELLTLIAETFCAPGDEVLYAQYGFAVYQLAARGAGATPVAVPANAQLNVLPEAMLACITACTKLVYLANPNNPTGTHWTRAQLAGFLSALPSRVLFILDEAYLEYVTDADLPDGLSFLAEHPQLILARTFSKAYGLAALRVGYTIAHPDLARMLERTRLSFNVNALALRAAALAIADQQHIAQIRSNNAKQRALLSEALTALGLTVFPSQGNFLLVHFARDTLATEQALLERGVIVRPMRGYGLPHYLRITVGQAWENEKLLAALRDQVGASLTLLP